MSALKRPKKVSRALQASGSSRSGLLTSGMWVDEDETG